MEKLDPNHFIGCKITSLTNFNDIQMNISGRPFSICFREHDDYEKYYGHYKVEGSVNGQIITDISDVKTLYTQNIKDRETIYYEIERTITIKTEKGKLTVTAKYENIVKKIGDIPNHETILSADFYQAYLPLNEDYIFILCGWEEDDDKIQAFYQAYKEFTETGIVSDETISMLVLADYAESTQNL